MRKIVILLICLSLLSVGNIFASTTGKISGLVVDAETNRPLPGTNIVIEGSLMGASSDLDGYYFIINIPPGTYTLRISQIGYKEVVIKDVKVSVDMTAVQNIKLNQTVLETDEVVIVEAERPLVQMDMTSSLQAVGSDEIDALPVRSVNDILALQAGIIRSRDDIHIRGGRASEVAYWVDGISTTDVYNGKSGLTVENAAIDELQVISGTFNAEYGEAMSGIINLVTKEGSRKYNGRIEAYAGDYLSGHKPYQVLKNYSTVVVNGDSEMIGDVENPLKKLNPIYNGEFTLSGPVPFLKDNLSFFTNTRYFESEGYIYGRSFFKPNGTPGDSSLAPMNPNRKLSTQEKVTLRLGANIKINYNVFFNRWKNDRIYAPPYRTYHLEQTGVWDYRLYKYDPLGIPKEEGYGLTHIVTLNHILSASTFYELRFNQHYNEYKRYVFKDLKTGVDGYTTRDILAAPVGNSYHNDGMDMDQERRSTEFWSGKFDLTSQLNNMHLLKAGLEFTTYRLKLNQFSIIEKSPLTPEEQAEPFFHPAVPTESSDKMNRYTREPYKFALYMQDKMEVGNNIIINAGLRFDFFDAKSVMPTDPRDPDIYNPILVKNKYKDAPDSMAYYNAKTDYDTLFTQYTPEERRAFMHQEVDAKMQLSPRLGIAYPISSEGVIHFSYGHFFQMPEFQYLYFKPDFKTGAGAGNILFGNADLKPQKTVMYEIGLQQQLSPDIGIDVTLFYRDIRDWIGTGTVRIHTYQEGRDVIFYENKDYSNVRGVTLRFEKRQSANFSTRFDYTFQVAEGTYSNPKDAFNSIARNEEPHKALIPLGWDQTHTLNTSIIYNYANWTVSLIGFYWTGTPYTPTNPYAEVSGSLAALKGWRENMARKPDQKRVDLYINKRVYFGGLSIDLFCNVYNLFDNQNVLNVYQDTGTADHNTYLDPGRVTYNNARVGTIDDFETQPSWYAAPREINLGLAIGF
jgi:outer membrane receptor for ferrienterochelin and colicin